MTRPVLVTGFEPFGGDAVNPSAEVARTLHGRAIGDLPVVGLVLPCVFGVALDTLHAALDAHRPRLVLALGLAGSRSGFSLERVAVNIDDARIPDNAGAQPIDQPVVPGAAAARFTTLPVKAMIAALRRAGHEAELSNSAGTFVCNHVFYGLQHALRKRRGVRSGFMHLPRLPAQVGPGEPSLSLASMVDGVSIALATALAHAGDLRASEGALD
ncbi:MAG TPA: pyroglutamyl-peptidase I [Burkholderiaceae bacterium]|nr:pyroglutamyl-peptidase I [Burkholderiaceae bacterium]